MKGIYTAMITPFDKEGKLDREGFIANLKDQLRAEVDGVVVLGTTGEAHTLSPLEQEQVIDLALDTVGDRLEVIVGSGSNSTEETIEKVKRAKRMQAHGALVVSPYYNKPTQKGLYEHFKAITEGVSFPIILYNHPGRTGVNLDPLTVREIAQLPHIKGIKDASGDMGQIGELITHTPKDFAILSGNDSDTLPTMALGGHGVISTLSNLAPTHMMALVRAMEEGDLEKAKTLHFQLYPVFKGLGFETNPIPIKEAMTFCGKAAGIPRLPLHEMSEPQRFALHQLLIDAKLTPAGVSA